MMPKFIYVFSAQDRDTLLSNGYSLLKADYEKKIFVFENKPCSDTPPYYSKIKCVETDVLTF